MEEKKITLRTGEKKDLPAVMALVQELALYEKAPNEVITSVAQMERDGFGAQPVFYFFVAEEEGVIVGMALYYFKYSTWKGRGIYLDDIVVTQPHRRRGIGKLLMDEMIRIAAREGAMKLEWQVLDWNTPAIEFYKKYQSELDGEWINCKLTHEQLQAAAKKD